MCLAIPGKVIKVSGRRATVKYPGTTREAAIFDITPRVGNFVMVQMGIIVKILSHKEATAAFAAWQQPPTPTT